jgi:16S rRNA processing protein RimM
VNNEESEGRTIAVARIARARGIRGEVVADYHTDFPSRFADVDEVWVAVPGRARERRRIEEAWDHQGRLVLKLEGIDTVESAAALAGAWVEVDSREAVALPEGSYFDHDLVGCTVVDSRGEELGRIKEVLRLEGNHQLVVEHRGADYMIPARAEFCTSIRIDERRVVVDLPEGLIDLNR